MSEIMTYTTESGLFDITLSLNDNRPSSWVYHKQNELDEVENEIENTALYRYIKSLPQYDEVYYLAAYQVEQNEELYNRCFPDLPNVDMDLLRRWWVLYRPLAEETDYMEFYFGQDGEADEPNDRELIIELYAYTHPV